MMFAANNLAVLDTGAAVMLGPDDLVQMHDLAANAGLTALEANPFRHGPVLGVRKGAQLAAMAGTRMRIPGAVETGNIATRTTHRRRGYARQAVSALVRAHSAEGERVFLMVFQSNRAAVHLYEGMGFVRQRPMFLLRCRLEAK